MRKPVFVSLYLTFIFSVLLLNSSSAQVGATHASSLSLTLDKCVEMTLENNEQILKAQQVLAEAEGALTAARADEYLQMDFTSWYQRAKRDNKFETKDYNGTLRAEQLLLRFGELPKRLDEAQEQYRKAELELQSARMDAVDQTRRIFYGVILIQDEMKEREVFRDEIEKKRVRIEGRLQEKRAVEIDLLGVELELARQELRINELKRDLRVKKTELLQIIGADEEAEINIEGELPDTGFVVENCIAAAMANRTELKDFRGQIERQERIVKEMIWQLLPELESSYRYKDTSINLEQEDGTWDTSLSYEKPIWEKEGGEIPKRDKWEFSFGLTFPIFDGFRVKGMMQSEEAILEKLKIEFLQKEKQIRLEVRNAYKEVANAKENMDIQEKMLTLSRKTLERMEAIMETPVISQKYPHLAGITFDDVLRAREDYADAQTTYFAQKRNYMEARENLRQKMGIIE
jgi:outer membrane protein TolC